MPALPEPIPPPTDRSADHHTAPPTDPAAPLAPLPLSGPVELSADRPPVVWVPDAYGRLVPMPKTTIVPTLDQYTPTPPPAVSGPRFDPQAQRLVGVGVAAVGVGAGGALLLDALAGSLAGLALLVAALLLAKHSPAHRGSGETHITVTNTTRWFGKSTTTIR